MEDFDPLLSSTLERDTEDYLGKITGGNVYMVTHI